MFLYFTMYNILDFDQLESLRNFVKIKQLQEETASILQNLPSGIITRSKDSSTDIRLYNSVALNFLGLSPMSEIKADSDTEDTETTAKLLDKMNARIFKLHAEKFKNKIVFVDKNEDGAPPGSSVSSLEA